MAAGAYETTITVILRRSSKLGWCFPSQHHCLAELLARDLELTSDLFSVSHPGKGWNLALLITSSSLLAHSADGGLRKSSLEVKGGSRSSFLPVHKIFNLIIKLQAQKGNLNPILEYGAPTWILGPKTQSSPAVTNPEP